MIRKTGERIEIEMKNIKDFDLKGILDKAEQGYAVAQFELGCCYAYGACVEKDHMRAKEWFEKSAKQGNADAQYFLGFHHYGSYEEGNPKDLEPALEYYISAAKQGNLNAQYNLALHYYLDESLEQNLELVVEGLEDAASQGVLKAREILEKIASA